MGLRIIKQDTNINFVGMRKLAFLVSLLMILVGVGSLVAKGGPAMGIDFAGGLMFQVKFEKHIELEAIQDSLSGLDLQGLTVQRFGDPEANEYLIRVPSADLQVEQVQEEIEGALQGGLGEAAHEFVRSDMVGPKVGSDLRTKALEAMFYAVLFIAIYISGRFEQRWWAAGIMAAGLAAAMYVLDMIGISLAFMSLGAIGVTLVLCWYLKLNYALGAVVALIHDVLIVIGVFSLMNKEFDLTIVAALLTIIGYSLNDTIIVFDRIRENLRRKISKLFGETVNKSINQTLSRTLLTSGTTLLVVLCLYLMGGAIIHDFAFALLIGVVVGTYSSIFVASPILLTFQPSEDPEQSKK